MRYVESSKHSLEAKMREIVSEVQAARAESADSVRASWAEEAKKNSREKYPSCQSH